jgi:hypothetical protein
MSNKMAGKSKGARPSLDELRHTDVNLKHAKKLHRQVIAGHRQDLGLEVEDVSRYTSRQSRP